MEGGAKTNSHEGVGAVKVTTFINCRANARYSIGVLYMYTCRTDDIQKSAFNAKVYIDITLYIHVLKHGTVQIGTFSCKKERRSFPEKKVS